MGLDAVEIVMALEHTFGFEIEDKEAEKLQTTRHIIDFVCRKLNVDETVKTSHCLTARAFYQLRRSVAAVTGLSRREIRPSTSLREHFAGPVGRERWAALGQHLGVKLPALPSPALSWLGFSTGPGRCDALTYALVAGDLEKYYNPNEPWSRGQIRQIVRVIIGNLVGECKFSDDANIMHELGL